MLDEVSSSVGSVKRPELNQCEIELKQVTVKWPSAGEQEDYTLKDVSVTVRPGQILAVVGPVGSGKVIQHCYSLMSI